MKEKKQILIVDDEEDICDLIQYHLEDNGFQTLTSNNSWDALNLLSKNKPNLIILDLMLPGIDGLNLCRLIKEEKETSEIPIMLITARSDKQTIDKGYEMGASDYITKPFNCRDLVNRVYNYLYK